MTKPLVPFWFNKRTISHIYAPIAQLDRALVYGTCSPVCALWHVSPLAKHAFSHNGSAPQKFFNFRGPHKTFGSFLV